jgi:hypothetical protein
MSHFQQNPLSLSVPDEHFQSWAASNGEAVAAATAGATARRPPRNRHATRRSAHRPRGTAPLTRAAAPPRAEAARSRI